jgi:hypothetical protein
MTEKLAREAGAMGAVYCNERVIFLLWGIEYVAATSLPVPLSRLLTQLFEKSYIFLML